MEVRLTALVEMTQKQRATLFTITTMQCQHTECTLVIAALCANGNNDQQISAKFTRIRTCEKGMANLVIIELKAFNGFDSTKRFVNGLRYLSKQLQ